MDNGNFLPDPMPELSLADCLDIPEAVFDLGLGAHSFEVAAPFLLGFYETEHTIKENRPHYKIGGLIYRRIVTGPRNIVTAAWRAGTEMTPTPTPEDSLEFMSDPFDYQLSENPSQMEMQALFTFYPGAVNFELMSCSSKLIKAPKNFGGFLFVGYRNYAGVRALFCRKKIPIVVGGFVVRSCIRDFALASCSDPFWFKYPPPNGNPAVPHVHDNNDLRTLRPGFCSMSSLKARSSVGLQILTANNKIRIMSSLHPFLLQSTRGLMHRIKRYFFLKLRRYENRAMRLKGVVVQHRCQSSRHVSRYGQVDEVVEDSIGDIFDTADMSNFDMVLIRPDEHVSVENIVDGVRLLHFAHLRSIRLHQLLEFHPEHLDLPVVRLRYISRTIMELKDGPACLFTFVASQQAAKLFGACQSPVFDRASGTCYAVVRFLNCDNNPNSLGNYEIVLQPLPQSIISSTIS